MLNLFTFVENNNSMYEMSFITYVMKIIFIIYLFDVIDDTSILYKFD